MILVLALSRYLLFAIIVLGACHGHTPPICLSGTIPLIIYINKLTHELVYNIVLFHSASRVNLMEQKEVETLVGDLED